MRNDAAKKLSKICKGIKLCKVNLIPANLVEKYNIEPPGKLETLLFRDYLLKQAVNITLRKPRGQDIKAACGQLRLIYENKYSTTCQFNYYTYHLFLNHWYFPFGLC